MLSSPLGDRFSMLLISGQLPGQGGTLPIGFHAVGRLGVLVQDAQGGRRNAKRLRDWAHFAETVMRQLDGSGVPVSRIDFLH
jgi:hypothetical protein